MSKKGGQIVGIKQGKSYRKADPFFLPREACGLVFVGDLLPAQRGESDR
jgi:hypothetical protein